MYAAFMNHKKAYDEVNRKTLLEVHGDFQVLFRKLTMEAVLMQE